MEYPLSKCCANCEEYERQQHEALAALDISQFVKDAKVKNEAYAEYRAEWRAANPIIQVK